MDSLRWSKLSLRKREYLVLALIMLLGIFLRFYQLETIPVGLSGDEAEDGFVAKRILRGEEYPIFIAGSWGEEPMHTYLVAFSIALWGSSLWAVRLDAAVIGVLTIPVVFWLAKELFADDEQSSSWIGMWSALWVATSYWHIIYSRFGLEVITLPLFSSAMLYFLSRGIRSDRKWPFIASGLLLGASLYAYRGARFFPICLLIIFGGWLVTSTEFRRRHLINLALLVVVAVAIYAPLGTYAVTHPHIYFDREMHVSILNPDWDRGSPLNTFAMALVKTMGMFNFQGDPEFDRNPGRRPVLDPISSLCFFVGLAICLWRWKRPNYLVVVLWFLIMALPGAFTAEVFPHFHRAIGALPPLCLLSGIGIVSVKDWWGRRMTWRGAREVSWAILSFVLISTSFLSYRDYFEPWQRRLAKEEITGGIFMEAAAVMNETRISNGVWILPATSLRPRNLPFYEIDFLYEGPEPEFTLNVDEETVGMELSEICQGHRQAAVVNWKQFVLEEAYLSLNSDPKRLLDFLLRKYGRRIAEEPFESFDLVTYELPASPDFAIAQSFKALDVNFGDELRLVGIALGGSSLTPTSTPEEVELKVLPSGNEGWVVLRWQAVQAPSRNYKVGIYLLDSQRRLMGQVDKFLLGNHLRPTSGWNAGQIEMDYYNLPSMPATPPGEYSIEVAVYDADTMERMTIFDEHEGVTKTSVVVGTLDIIEPLVPPQVEPMEQLKAVLRDIAPGIRLLGYDLPESAVGPGETLRLALYWKALEDVRQDYLLSLALRDGEGEVRIEQRGRPVDETYPTTEWDEGEVLRDWHDLPLPADIPQGAYELSVGVLEEEELLGEVALGQVEVRGRARRFTIPEIGHPMEARLGEGTRFLGYDLISSEVRAGGTLQLTLYWQALEEMEASYTVFTHILDAEERIWGQKDSIPGGGEAPTTSWVAGEILTDQYEIMVDPEASPGEYVIEIGMYDASTGQRLPLLGDDQALEEDRLLLAAVQVVP